MGINVTPGYRLQLYMATLGLSRQTDCVVKPATEDAQS